MYRYFAFAAKPGHSIQEDPEVERYCKILFESSPNYLTVFNSKELKVLECRSSSSRLTHFLIGDDSGILLGSVFNNKGRHVGRNIPVAEGKHISQTCGDALVKEYWGRYIAFIVNQDGVFILPDPIGGIECLIFDNEKFYCVFSDIHDFNKLKILNLSINWNYMACHVVVPLKEQPITGLCHIDKLQPGKRLEISKKGMLEKRVWDPGRIYKESAILRPEDAAESLRDAMLMATKAWTELYERLLLTLSGGLDSAIVLGCIAKNGRAENIECVNFYSRNAESDERKYARAAARFCGSKLLEIEEIRDNINLEIVNSFRYSAEPVQSLENIIRGPDFWEVIKSTKCTAIFDGHNGDGIFGQPISMSAIDYFWEHGADFGLIHALHQSARISQRSIWAVGRKAVEVYFSRDPSLARPAIDPDIENHYRSMFPAYSPEYLNTDTVVAEYDVDNLPPEKIRHISYMVLPNKHWYPNIPDQIIESCHPIISQPVIEASCRIPTYFLNYGGRSRGLARKAFEDCLPSEILTRMSKGGVDNFLDKIFMSNFEFIRNFFLEGVLVKNGMLNKTFVESAFSMGNGKNVLTRINLLMLLNCESWSRQWSDA